MKQLLKSVGSFVRSIADEPAYAPPAPVPAQPAANADDVAEITLEPTANPAGKAITDRVQAYLLAMDAVFHDPRPIAEIIKSMKANRGRSYEVLLHGTPPSDLILIAMCAEYKIPLQIEPVPRATKFYSNLPSVPLRTLDRPQKPTAPKATKQTENPEPALDRREALEAVFARVAVEDRGTSRLARQIGLPQWQLSKCLHQGLLPSDKLLAGLCDEYGIKYAFEVAHKCPPKPEHYEGMTAVSPRLETNPSSAMLPVMTSPMSPPEAENPGNVEGAIDYEQLETQIASLEGFVFQARTSADAAAKLPAALAKVAALEIDLAASKARERNLYLDLEKAVARAETAEGHLGRIQAILPSGFSAR